MIIMRAFASGGISDIYELQMRLRRLRAREID